MQKIKRPLPRCSGLNAALKDLRTRNIFASGELRPPIILRRSLTDYRPILYERILGVHAENTFLYMDWPSRETGA